ncbi:MAG: monoterpene epsilon-lactone hydrolase [Pseudomonadales bacterium]|jgi:monoterpene epsilon-lactone hydrolase
MAGLFYLGGIIVLWFTAVVIAFFAIAKFYLQGKDHSSFDQQSNDKFPVTSSVVEQQQILGRLGDIQTADIGGNPFGKKHIAALRHVMNTMFNDKEFNAGFKTTVAAGVPGEWVMAPGVDTKRRVLYIHGGAFTMGSSKSHRPITSEWSRLANAAVLVIDYRLMPENSRIDGIEDCRSAYQWILDNGPTGPEELNSLFVSGDSAGGNLTLSLIAWVRDQGLRAPNGAVALSPQTDNTISSPSMKGNIKTDPMLGPIFGKLTGVPTAFLLWFGFLNTRINPSAPIVSPLFGDLSNLPPLLIQASTTEMLVDDAKRYVNKAQQQGSPAKLQLWDNMVHVWQIFHPDLAEATQAFEEIEKFVKEVG